MREPALALHPDCLEKLMWGAKALGVRVTLAEAPAALVKQLVSQAHAHKAAKPPARKKSARKTA